MLDGRAYLSEDHQEPQSFSDVYVFFGLTAEYPAVSAEIKNLMIRPVLNQKIPEIIVLPEIPSWIRCEGETKAISRQKIWGPTWFVKFKLKISSFPTESEEMTNILHFSTGYECCGSGSRIPAVFLRWDQRLVVFTYISGKENKEIVVDQRLSLNAWIFVTIMQGEDVSLSDIIGFIITTLHSCIYRISVLTSMKRESAISATPAPNNMKKLSFLLVNIIIRPRASLERKKITFSSDTLIRGGGCCHH